MSTLVIDELITELEQSIIIRKKINVGSIRTHFYLHNAPSGVFNFEIHKDNNLV